MEGWPCLVVLLIGTAGCLGSGLNGPQEEPFSLTADGRGTIVALLDTGINPYHLSFRAHEEFAPAPFGIPATPLDLTQVGSLEERIERDRAVWEGIEKGRLYHVRGTRLLLATFSWEPNRLPMMDPIGHGTKTASVVARDAPDALILMVQVDTRMCIPVSCLASPTMAEAMAWMAEQPWIDVISVSLAMPANVPNPDPLYPEGAAYARATRAAHDAGKLVVNGAGNDPPPSLLSYFNGPSWIIDVGGAQPAAGGESPDASRAVDVMANYTQTVADASTLDGHTQAIGTSLATPVVAATLAEALHRWPGARAMDPVHVRQALRDALNASAIPIVATDWRPTASPPPTNLTNAFSQSAPVLAAGPQGGWGYIHAGLAHEIAERAAGADTPPKASPVTARWQAEWQALREARWGRGG